MSLAAEADVGAMYINAREAVPAGITLEELGHSHPPPHTNPNQQLSGSFGHQQNCDAATPESNGYAILVTEGS